MRIRTLDPDADRKAIERLWLHCLPGGWPVLPQGLGLVRGGVAAVDGEELVGVAGRNGAALQLLLVAPDQQRHGIGSELVGSIASAARADGHAQLSLGSGGDGYIWPGVPTDLDAAGEFFSALGFEWDYSAIDLVALMAEWVAPAKAVEVADHAPARVAPAGHNERAAVVEFEALNFPKWARQFETTDGILAAWHGNRVVGSLLYAGSGSPYAPAIVHPCGSVSCVGVHPEFEGRGIATALVLEATRLVRSSGAAACHVGWAWQTNLYERAGYRPWRYYRMGAKVLR